MESIDFVKFCDAAHNANIDVSEIRSRVFKLKNKLIKMRNAGQQKMADSAARSAVYGIQDMAEGLEYFSKQSPIVSLDGATYILGSLLPKLSNFGEIEVDFIGLAAVIFGHFDQGKPHSIDKVIEACVEQCKEFITDTDLNGLVLNLIEEFTHQKVFLAAMIPASVTDEEIVGICINIPIHQEIQALHVVEERISFLVKKEYWRSHNVDNAFTFVRLYVQLLTIRLIIMCSAYDVISHAAAFRNIAKGYRAAMMSYIAIAKEVLYFFKTGEMFALTSCVGPVEWSAIYNFLPLLGVDRSQCGDWVFIPPEGYPLGAISAGTGYMTGEDYYIGRTEFRDELVVGKIFSKKMYWTSNGVEYTTSNTQEYEILCITDKKVHAMWKMLPPGADPENLKAYRAGRSEYGEVYYVGRMSYMNELVIGKIYEMTFYFPFYGNEIIFTDTAQFEILCLASR